MDPITIPTLISNGPHPWSIQLDRPDGRIMVSSCSHGGRVLPRVPEGIVGAGVTVGTGRKARGGVQAYRAVDDPKTISFELMLWAPGCNCDAGQPDPYKISGMFAATGVDDAVLTYVDGFGKVLQFVGRPKGASLIEQTPQFARVRCQFLATDPRGYSPLGHKFLEVRRDVTNGVSTVGDTVTVEVFNQGNAPGEWWVEKTDGLIIGDFELSMLSLEGTGNVVRRVTVPSFDTPKDYPRLPLGRVRLGVYRMNVHSVGNEVDMLFKYRQAWV